MDFAMVWIKICFLILFLHVPLFQTLHTLQVDPLPESCLDMKPESDSLCGPGKKLYYFNRKKGRCSSFMHHGCRKSKNVFRTRSECQRTCACNLSLNHGSWCKSRKEYEIRYYFEKKSGLCRPFWYSRCGGNHNRFATVEYCVRVCKGR